MRGWIVAGLVMSMGCAYHAVEYESGEGSMVCVTTTYLSGRLTQDYTGEVVLQEEVLTVTHRHHPDGIIHLATQAPAQSRQRRAATCRLVMVELLLPALVLLLHHVHSDHYMHSRQCILLDHLIVIQWLFSIQL